MNNQLLQVTERMVGVHPTHPDYPLLPGDVLTRSTDGTFQKHTGLGMFGFTLSDEQASSLVPVEGHIVPVGGM